MIIRESVRIGDKTLTLETGRIAKQAGGSVLVESGDSVVLVTATGVKDAKPFQHFLPLTVDYQEKTYAAGKIPGGFFKREGRLRDHEVLTSRLIDRPCRPLFPDGYRAEIQIIATVLSADQVNPTDVLAMTGASAAMHLSPVPWAGPIAGVRVARVEGQLIANPTFEQTAASDVDIVIAAKKDAIMMVEGLCHEISEADLLEVLDFGHKSIQPTLELIEQMREATGKEKWIFTPATRDASIDARVKEVALDGVKAACNVAEKHPRYAAFKKVKKETVAALAEEFPEKDGDIGAAYEDLRFNTMRGQVLQEKVRVDGRDFGNEQLAGSPVVSYAPKARELRIRFEHAQGAVTIEIED